MNEERARGIILETEYWQALLSDLLDVNETIRDIVSAVTIAIPETLRLVPQLDDAGIKALANTIETHRVVLNHAEKALAALERMVALADGRYKALAAELDAPETT